MRQSTLILFNAVSVYLRVLLTAPLGVLTVRFIYGGLEEIDYGLLTALGATAAFMVLFSNALTKSAQRHLAFEIGTGDQDRVRAVFKAVLATFLLIGVSVAGVGAILTPSVMSSLTIPEDRVQAAVWVYAASLFGIALQAVVTPYRAILSAHQNISILAAFEVLASVGIFIGAYCLRYVTGDKLIAFVVIQQSLSLAIAIGVIAVALRRYEASRSAPISNLGDMKEIGRFAFWSLLSNLATILRDKGMVVVANVLFGPVANAALALGAVVHRYMYMVANVVVGVVSPAVTSQAGKQNQQAVERFANFGGKMTFLATSVAFVPLVLETEQLLDLWQAKPVPEDTATHTRWLCAMALVGVTSWGHSMVCEAYNKVVKIALLRLAAVLSSVVIAWFGCRHFGWPATALTATMFFPTALLALLAMPWVAAEVLGKRFREVVAASVLPPLGVFAPCFLITVAVWFFTPSVLLRIPLVLAVYTALLIPATWFFALNDHERRSLVDIGARIAAKVFPKSKEM